MTRIALIQQKASADIPANIRRAMEAVRAAAKQGARIAAFAELAFEPFYPQRPADENPARLAQPIPGPVTEAFSALARELEIVIVLNLYESAGTLTFDSSPVIDADGTLLGVTRMIHITEYECFHEQGYYSPGDTGAPVYETRFGKIGVAICYDRHFPEFMRAMAIGGADIVFVPQAGSVGEWPEGLYEAEMRVASFQNGYFTALVNRVGREECLEFAGESFVCDPNGVVMARAGTGTEEVLMADLELSLCDQSHARKLFLRHRRPGIYGPWGIS